MQFLLIQFRHVCFVPNIFVYSAVVVFCYIQLCWVIVLPVNYKLLLSDRKWYLVVVYLKNVAHRAKCHQCCGVVMGRDRL
jgi:hypothetical protein